MRRFIIILSLIIVVARSDAQQQPLYTQFMFNKVALNPAFAGHDEFIHFNLLYRNQWVGLDGAPTIQQLSFNMPFPKQKIGIGVNLTRHSIGVTEMITLDGIYSYKFNLESGILSLGAQLSSRSLSVDFSDPRIQSIDNINFDPAISLTKQRKHILNVGLGAYFRNEQYFVGISLPRIMNAKIDFEEALNESTEVQHILIMGGGRFRVSETTDIIPQVLIRWAENSPITADLNASVEFYKKYTAGLTFRSGGDSGAVVESIDMVVAMNINQNLMLGFAYDITLSSLRKYQSGSVELLVHYNLGVNNDLKEFVNPRFF